MTTWRVVSRRGIKLHKPYYHFIKRMTDIILCLLAGLLLLPIVLTIMIAIRLNSAGSVFFIQERVGKGGRRFKLIKFRTMYADLDQSSHHSFMQAYVAGKIQPNGDQTIFKPFAANHVTSVGRILRKTSLDELPQLINVLKGEMSLVGPRPNLPCEVEVYHLWHTERLEVLPGITGLAQVHGRSGLIFDKIVEYDIEYIQNLSIKQDFKILWMTVSSVIFGKGAY